MDKKEPVERQTEKNGRVKLALALVVGLAIGSTLNIMGANVGASRDANAQDGMNAAINQAAAPGVSLDASGRARFSRPLEVPPLYAFDSPLGSDEFGRQIILVDSATKRICVYWVRQRGVNSTIELVATRGFELDLKLDDFNGEGLTPGQIREQLENAHL